ncbi:asparagine synthase (glutamine-hydrolyzing) [Fulvivirgaceae bacterium BMA10]|uniref:asparagine synthase (glutamine-hydrolyzing) n=1 Tax=Splendidivirga corallicola TaxID=3051826 RepID=A0ABT8KSZ0_9BACT|nr:asparagine synthase (glutamine-hydrolyzing) [Fulvivirgaceae bacterium BMA10]
MCGITGIYAFNEVGRFNMINLSGATDKISSRGPDSKGMFTEYNVGLGHRRLSIIDTSSDGNQPMHDDSGRFTIIFNGEIYNYRELRAGLERLGVTFQSNSDTEVLLKLFIREKKDCLGKLNGFFSFAIFDKEENSLFIARDRIGIKPLLYYHDEDKLIFGSEMKSILAYGIEKEIDYTSLYQYLQFNYIIAPATILKGVKKLLPGHFMMIKGKQVQIEKYYQVAYNRNALNPNNLSYEQQKQQLIDKLEKSVKKRLVADVPLGAFLSGGIDSSVITALASRHVEKLNTFSIGYKDEPFFDETKYANLVAKKFDTNHTVFSLSNQDLYEHLFDILDYIDEPFADSSAIPVYILSKHTREIATVALSGDGADEMFSGYNKHSASLRVAKGGTAAQLVKGALPLWNILPKSRNNAVGNKIRQLQRFAIGMRLSNKERYWRWAQFTSESEAFNVLNKSSKEQLDQDDFKQKKLEILKYINGNGDINDVLYTDMHLVLTNDMLTKVDLMSMANSLEIRVPFLDHELVDFAFSLPQSSKINENMRKRILQDSFRDILPPELYNRPKHGFEIPLLKWFRSELRSLIEHDLLRDQFIQEQNIFDGEEIKKLKKKLFSSNPGDIHARIWGLIVFQWWWKKNMA